MRVETPIPACANTEPRVVNGEEDRSDDDDDDDEEEEEEEDDVTRKHGRVQVFTPPTPALDDDDDDDDDECTCACAAYAIFLACMCLTAPSFAPNREKSCR